MATDETINPPRIEWGMRTMELASDADLMAFITRRERAPLTVVPSAPTRVPMLPPPVGHTFAENFKWSARFIPQIRAIVGQYLLVQAPLEIDRTEATDLMLFTAADMRIAARVRRARYAVSFPHDFTLSASTRNGSPSEYDKIAEGFADWMFYGFAETDNGRPVFAGWYLIDLHKWRAAFVRGVAGKSVRRTNPHDKREFIAYDVRTFPDLLIAGRPPGAR